jgi:precorrin-2/cobalt-factor-2 C20-methyltransferase
MTNDEKSRDGEILRQLRDYSHLWNDAQSAAVPVIGDSALYASVSYLYKIWKSICPALGLKLIPGISAHSLASGIAGEFLAMGEERMAILPGSCDFSRLTTAMDSADCVALYKPSATGKSLPDLVASTGPWSKAVRVHRAGLPDEHVVCGEDACAPTDDYLSILLLWRNRD